jgi:recombination protein RecR
MLPTPIENVIENLLFLQGFGKRGAQKVALDLLMLKEEKLEALLNSIVEMKNQVSFCERCGFFSSGENTLCNICLDLENSKRDGNKICLVEKPTDVLNLEKTMIYNGVYHILEKLISPIDNVFASDTKIGVLFEKTIPQALKKFDNIELILFFKSGFSADTTIAYLKEVINENGLNNKVKLTQLAQGLPLYYTADNLDKATMVKALEDRREVG